MDFTERLKTFRNYTGLINIIQLSINGYYHTGENIIKCENCENFFICFNKDYDFFKKHKENLCNFLSPTHSIRNEYVSKDILNNWLKKEFIINLIESGINKELIMNYLNEFLYIKGSDASLRLFKEFYNLKIQYSN